MGGLTLKKEHLLLAASLAGVAFSPAVARAAAISQNVPDRPPALVGAPRESVKDKIIGYLKSDDSVEIELPESLRERFETARLTRTKTGYSLYLSSSQNLGGQTQTDDYHYAFNVHGKVNQASVTRTTSIGGQPLFIILSPQQERALVGNGDILLQNLLTGGKPIEPSPKDFQMLQGILNKAGKDTYSDGPYTVTLLDGKIRADSEAFPYPKSSFILAPDGTVVEAHFTLDSGKRTPMDRSDVKRQLQELEKALAEKK